MGSTIYKKFQIIKRLYSIIAKSALSLPLAVILTASVANAVAQKNISKSLMPQADTLGGPEGIALLSDAISGIEIINNTPPGEGELAFDEEDPGFIIVGDSALLNTGNPVSSVIQNRDGLLIYKVQKGDTLSSIAANFGVSLNTIYWANSKINSRSLSIGQEIVILPTTGVIHQVQSDESLGSIASTYGVPESRIMKFNKKILAAGITPGANLIIPDAKPAAGETSVNTSKLPDLRGYYAIPTTGWNWGKLHYNNAVDIANACGTPIYAAAEGLVLESLVDGWNSGYGGYIIIEHPNGTKTRYSHNSKNVVAKGDYVLQGDTIAYIGNTGNVHGPTGCHLHFEVMGARNSFAK